jgi:predicted amidohydrolase
MKVALVQYPVEGRLTLENFSQKVRGYLEQASRLGAELVVFPELFLLDCIDRIDPETDALALGNLADHMQSYIEQPRAWSREFGLHILFGTMPWRMPSRAIRNRAYFFSKSGQPHFQDKIFLTPDEKSWGWEGGSELRPFSLDGVSLQILICYDIQFASLSHLLSGSSIDGILCPSLTEEYGLERVAIGCQARAIENFLQVFVTGATGGKGGFYRSRAALYGPRNQDFPGPQEITDREIVVFSWDVQSLRKLKAGAGIWSGRDALRKSLPVNIHDCSPLSPGNHLGHEVKV